MWPSHFPPVPDSHHSITNLPHCKAPRGPVVPITGPDHHQDHRCCSPRAHPLPSSCRSRHCYVGNTLTLAVRMAEGERVNHGGCPVLGGRQHARLQQDSCESI